jgi:hypothetical protein
MQQSQGLKEAALATYQSGIQIARTLNDAHALSELQQAMAILEE